MNTWKCIEPIINHEGSAIWLGLSENHELFTLDTTNHKKEKCCAVDLSALTSVSKLSMKVSVNGDYVAIAETYGQYGTVIDLSSGQEMFSLDRGDYETGNKNSRFSFAFAQVGGLDTIIHATQWNRLDVTELHTGRCLTDRADRSQNYFHASLHVSPSHIWMIDNGWIWHPIGIMQKWKMDEWINDNPFMLDENISVLTGSEHFWDRPLCFIDENRVAVWGKTVDDEQSDDDFLSAISIFDMKTSEESSFFLVPHEGELFVEDDFIYVVSKEHGTSKWNLTTGELVKEDHSFKPHRYHPNAKLFLQIGSGAELSTTMF